MRMKKLEFEELRTNARAKISEGALPKTLKDVVHVTAAAQNHPSSDCGVCNDKFVKGELWYLLQDTSKTSPGVFRSLHFLCHAAPAA